MSTKLVRLIAGLLACTLTRAALAEEPRRIAISADLGYAFPSGRLERGSNVSDVSFGLAELGLDGAYRLNRTWSAGLALHSGAAIPTLCASSSDCVSSLGHDIRLGALGRWHAGTWKSFEPDVQLELGYEWLTAKLVDRNATSKRGYRGVQASIRVNGPFAISPRVSIGPLLELTSGIFSHASLDAPGVSTSAGTDGSQLHLWTYLGFGTTALW